MARAVIQEGRLAGYRKSGTETLHESLDRDVEVVGGSDKSFGLTFAAVFLLLAGTDFWLWKGEWSGLWLALSALFTTVALSRPALLHPLNRVWTGFGMLLHVVVNPIVMATIFFVAFVPTGMLMRALGKDPLRLRWDPRAGSYWVARDPPGPDPKGMTNQF